MNNVVVLNPDHTLSLGRTEHEHTVLHVNTGASTGAIVAPSTKPVIGCIVVDMIKMVCAYHLFFTLHLLLHCGSCILCIQGLKQGNVQKIRQYGGFHLFEILIFTGMYFFEPFIILATIFLFDLVCFIVVQKYLSDTVFLET